MSNKASSVASQPQSDLHVHVVLQVLKRLQRKERQASKQPGNAHRVRRGAVPVATLATNIASIRLLPHYTPRLGLPPKLHDVLSAENDFYCSRPFPCLLLRPGKPLTDEVMVRVGKQAGEQKAKILQWTLLVRASVHQGFTQAFPCTCMLDCQGPRTHLSSQPVIQDLAQRLGFSKDWKHLYLWEVQVEED